MIIVVRGHASSSTGRSKIASQLSNHTNFPLFHQDDVSKALQASFPSTSSSIQPPPPPPPAPQNDLTLLSFKILHQMASSQLRLNHGVIINSAISDHIHLDQLNQLAKSQGVDLILIQCRPPDEIDDYDVGAGGRKLTVNTTEPFRVEEFVSQHLPGLAVAPQPKAEKPHVPKGKPVKTPSLKHHKRVTESIHRHLHALVLSNKPKNEDRNCKRCRQSIPGLCYHCLDCDEYIFHKSCAEDPGNLELVPDYLKAKDPKGYGFPEKQRHKCSICEEESKGRGFSRDCHDCLFETNMKLKEGSLPIVVNHESHSHPLNLIIMPISINYEYGCYGCGEFGKSISYRCYDCNINLHVGCASLPRTASSEHDKHTLRLVYDVAAVDHNYLEKCYCQVCKKEVNPEQWFYSCSICDTVTHIVCASATATATV
ncbi:hypothetical protein GQ457_06G020250 [Hibiscus cannabinus]